MKLQRVDVVLVPFDHLAVAHRRRLDRHQIVEPVIGSARSRRDAGRDARGVPISCTGQLDGAGAAGGRPD